MIPAPAAEKTEPAQEALTTTHLNVGYLASPGHLLYFVASEHLMQKGLPSRLLKLCFDPIVRRKGDTAVKTVKEMLATLKAGQNVAVFPEGSCSFNGQNEPFLPTSCAWKTVGLSAV